MKGVHARQDMPFEEPSAANDSVLERLLDDGSMNLSGLI